MRTHRHTGLALILSLAACGAPPADDGAPEDEPVATADSPAASVSILDPAGGSVIEGPSVDVRLRADGVRIVPAGEATEGSGHHHLYLDEDLGTPGVPVPTIPGRVIHLGTGASEYTFNEVLSGRHRLIAVVADGLHVPLQPWVVDTLYFEVR